MEWKKTIKAAILLILSAVLLTGCEIEWIFEPDDEENFSSEDVQVHFIDVGQGDSSLIISQNYRVLIDAGEAEAADAVNAYLDEKGIEKLDYIIATHPHSDHIGGLAKVIENNEVGTVIVPHMSDDKIPTTRVYKNFLNAVDSSGCELKEASVGEVIDLGISELKIIAPVTEDYSDLNNFSVVSQLDFGSTSFLFTGDAESASETDMLEANLLEDINVLKAGHHGSSSSSKNKFLEVIKPEYVVISCGVDNSYNHPNEKALERLTKYTENIYRTDLQGDIIITSDGTDIYVEYGGKD